MKRVKKHWYKQFVVECPICGRIDEWRERIYGRKPKDINKRYVYEQYYDHCQEG